MISPSHPPLAWLIALALLAASCSTTTDNSSEPNEVSSTADGATNPSPDAAEPTADAVTNAPPTTIDDTPTTPTESTPIPVIRVDDIAALIARWGNADGEPLDLARQIIGFPIEIAPPEGATPHRLSVALDGEDPNDDWTWSWLYMAVAAGATIGDIGEELPEGGPGTIETRLAFEAAFNSVGFDIESESFTSSLGTAGEQAVVFGFATGQDTYRLGEIDATPGPVTVIGDVDIDSTIGGAQGGFVVTVSLDAQPNFIPVPLLDALFQEVPVAPGARLTAVQFVSNDRADTDPDAAEGTRYFELIYTCELLPNSANAAHEVYSAGLDGSAYQVGIESADQPGFIEPTEAQVIAGVWTQPVIVLNRYRGEITVETGPNAAVTSTVSIWLEPNREPLAPISG